MEQSFLDYAMSVIVSRALPDVRDGLKPVHRRILWAMHDAGLRPDRPHRKCATVVGNVIGTTTPMVIRRSTTPWCAWVRTSLSVTFSSTSTGTSGRRRSRPLRIGTPSVALSTLAMHMLANIDEDTVDMAPNFDGSTRRTHGPAVAISESPGQRFPGHRRRNGDEHPAAQSRGDHRRHDSSHRTSRRHRRRSHGVRQGPRLPHRWPGDGSVGNQLRVPHRTRFGEDPRRRRDRRRTAWRPRSS